jgi:hypothetical protein
VSRPQFGMRVSAQEIAAHAQEHLACNDCGVVPGEPCDQPGGRIVCKSRYISAAIAVRRQAKAGQQIPEQAAERAVVLASLPKVPREEIEKCRTPRGGYSFTRAWFLEHGLPYPPIAGWRQAVERDDGSEDPGAAERAGALTSETVTALKNFDWLVRDRGPDEVALAWDTGSLAFGDSAVLIEELTRPGFTPATGDEDGKP